MTDKPHPLNINNNSTIPPQNEASHSFNTPKHDSKPILCNSMVSETHPSKHKKQEQTALKEKSEENQVHQYQFQQNDKRIIFNKKINTFLSSHRCKVISLIFAMINLLTIFINIMYYLNNKHFTLVILCIIIICVESLSDLILRLISIIKTKLIKSYALYANVVNIIMSIAIIITRSLNIISKQIFIGVTFVVCALSIVKNMMCFIRLCSEDHKRRENQKKIVQIIRFDSEIPDNNNNNNK